jgi:two-component system, NtrC family, response regulator AtoC
MGATRLLIVDDDESLCELLFVRVAKRSIEAVYQTSAEKALERLKHERFDVVVTDVAMDGMNGLELCDHIATTMPDVPVVVMTSHGGVDVAVSALRAGARDFLVKPFAPEQFLRTLDAALLWRKGRLVPPLAPRRAASNGVEHILGASRAMEELRELVACVAAVDASVLIMGESGTGKELVARAIHHASVRASGPFVALNCAAVPENLFEAELFGHTRGAFTDARTDRRGLCETAFGGTLFLDEIAELSMALQPKLLRALEERVIRPVGSSREIPIDVRVVAATNRDLARLVREGRFREDLYYRLSVVDVLVPPLRERGDDVLLCASHFAESYARAFGKQVEGLSPEAAQRLRDYPWPGNVRELKNAMARGVAIARASQIAVDDLPESLRRYRTPVPVFRPAPSRDELASLEEMERGHIALVLRATQGNRTAAAAILGLNRRTLQRKAAKYGLRGPDG